MEKELEETQNKIILKYKNDKLHSEKKLKKDNDLMKSKVNEVYKDLKIKFINDVKKLKMNFNNSIKALKDKQRIYHRNIEKNGNNNLANAQNKFKSNKISFLNEYNREKKNIESLIDIVEIVKTSYEKYSNNFFYCKNYSTVAKNTKGIKEKSSIKDEKLNIQDLLGENERLKNEIRELEKYKRASLSIKEENQNKIIENTSKKDKKKEKSANKINEPINPIKEENNIIRENTNKKKELLKVNINQQELLKGNANEKKELLKVNAEKKELLKVNANEIELLKANTNEKKELLKVNKNTNIKCPKKYETLTNNAFYNYYINKPYCAFKSILIYSNKKRAIICMDICSHSKLDEKKNAHDAVITNIRYFNDTKKGRDIIISISSTIRQINLWNWNGKKLENLKKFDNIYNEGYIYSAAFFNRNDNDFIITTNSSSKTKNECEPMKIFNCSNSINSQINESNENTFFIETLEEENNFYIITANYGKIKSYDLKKKSIYKIYNSKDDIEHYKFIIIKSENILKLIDLSKNENLRIWNYNSGELIKNIAMGDLLQLYDMCNWNNNSVFISCSDKKIILFNVETYEQIGEIIDNKEKSCIKSIDTNDNQKILFCQSVYGQIEIWK